MSISEIILFISTTSARCNALLPRVERLLPPGTIKYVRLDTERARTNAENGKFFQIHGVPTLVVTYADGNLQIFVEPDKVLRWIEALSKASEARSHLQPQERANNQPSRQERPGHTTPGGVRYGGPNTGPDITRITRGGNMYEPGNQPVVYEEDEDEEYEYPVRSVRKDTPNIPFVFTGRKAAKKAPPTIIEDDIEVPTSIEVDEIEVEEEPVRQPKKKVAKAKAKVAKKAKKVKKEVEEEPELIPDEDDTVDASIKAGRKLARQKLNNVAKAKSKPPQSKMKDIYNAAKQMAADRDNSLGYKEEDLPHYV